MPWNKTSTWNSAPVLSSWNSQSTWNAGGTGASGGTWASTTFAVDYANLDPSSPFAGNTEFSAIVAGDICYYRPTTTPGGNSVSMSGDGVFTLTPPASADESFEYYIHDISDGTDGPIGTITVSPVSAPAITAVSSIRGADIVTDEAQFTITGTGLTGTASVTVNGVAATAVTVVSDAEVTATAPHGFAAAYGSSGNVVVNNGTASNAYAVTLMPPQGMNYTAFTVDYAGLDPNSPYAGDTEFSNITVGAQDVYDAQTTPDGIAVSMSGDGVFTLASQPSTAQSFRTFIYDPTDQTVGADVTVTVEAVATATITSTGQTATDTQSATVSVIVSVNAGNQVAAEMQSGAFSVQSLATITSSGQVAQDSQSAAFEAVTGITAGNQAAVDTQAGAFSVETTLQAGNQAAQDSQSGAFHVAPVSTLTSTGQTATDSQSGGSFVLQVGGRRNINAQFSPGSTVTITLYDTITGKPVPLLGSSMIEIGGAGLFLFDLDKVVDQPIRRTEYAWVATDGTTTQTGVVVIEPEINDIWQRLDLDPDAPNTYAESLTSILGGFGRIDKANNGDGTVTTTRTP